MLEAYTGTITRIGVDVGFTAGRAMFWGVFTDTNRFVGMLAGAYAGATAEASIMADRCTEKLFICNVAEPLLT